ncbi:hypothetical protein, partial [Tessaracoccus lapidicaptus]
ADLAAVFAADHYDD